MSITETTRPTRLHTSSTGDSSAGSDSLNGQTLNGTQPEPAVEGQDSPQAMPSSAPNGRTPAGSKASRSHPSAETHTAGAAADDRPPAQARGSSASTADAPGLADGLDDFPGGQHASGNQAASATRDQDPPAAKAVSASTQAPLLADPLLALAADVLGDLEKVRIANENRLRQLTRSVEDSDGETRGFGLDEAHPDVARLAALVGMLGEAEHKATLNLQRVVRKHPLGPWMAAQKGIGEKQGARLLAALGDPYIRPEITREDGTVEPSRPRLVSELWAYCGYHVVPADHSCADTHTRVVGGELNGSDPGQAKLASQKPTAGVAPKRQRGQRANWSAAAKMRAFLVAEKCVQSGKGSNTTYYQVYAATRAKYADALHAAECTRCGPKGKPARHGSPLSDGHKHARALRAVAKEILRDLWREAKRIHETSVSGQGRHEPHYVTAADGADLPSAKAASTPTHDPPAAPSARPEGAEDSAAA